MDAELLAAKAQLREARNDLDGIQLEISDTRSRARKMEAVVVAARELRERWHGNPWIHEDVHEAGRQVMKAVRAYDDQRTKEAERLMQRAVAE